MSSDRPRQLTAVMVIRASTPGQEERTGPARQREDIEFSQEHFDLVIVREFPWVVTGKEAHNTPEGDEFQEWINRPDIDGCVVATIDRLSRDDSFTGQGDL